MNLAPLARWVLVALLALALAVVVWRLTRSDPAPAVTVSQGEIEPLAGKPDAVASLALVAHQSAFSGILR